MPLTDTQCSKAKKAEKTYRLFDQEGLFLEVLPTGTKSWRQKIRFEGTEHRISHGRYPAISLAEARQKALQAKTAALRGIAPSLHSMEEAISKKFNADATFKSIAEEWLSKQINQWTPRYMQSVRYRLNQYAFKEIGDLPIKQIKPTMVLSCLQKIEIKSPETTRRVKALCSHVFKYGIATGRNETDPTYGLESALRKFRKGHYAAISVDKFPSFLLKIHDHRDRMARQTFLALQLLMLTFVRTGEMIDAKRTEFDLENKMWIIPAERMKTRVPHMVPLSRQSMKIVKEMMEMNRNSEYLFPSYSRPRKPMSKNTILVAIKRMGYIGRMTGHGFRSLALGLLKEKLGYSHEIADRQLAHVPKNSVDRAYDRAQFLPQRIEMMQAFADYIDNVYVTAYKG